MKKVLRKRKFKRSVLLIFAFVAVVSLIGGSTVATSVKIKKEKQILAGVQSECDALEAENKKLKAIINSENKDAFIKKIARENGYVRPNERVYVDIATDK